jgi:hypothetical protein
MDPKMDPGMNAAQVRTLEERLQMNNIPHSSALTIREIVGVMDRLFVFQAMWLDGSPLAHTLFSCLYIHKPEAVLDDLYLSAFIPVFLKQCIVMRQIIETTSEVKLREVDSHVFRKMNSFAARTVSNFRIRMKKKLFRRLVKLKRV